MNLATPEEMTYWSPQTKALSRDAWWYACGRNDAAANRWASRLSTDPWDFSRWYGALAHDYHRNSKTHRPSINDAYSSYCAQRLAELI